MGCASQSTTPVNKRNDVTASQTQQKDNDKSVAHPAKHSSNDAVKDFGLHPECDVFQHLFAASLGYLWHSPAECTLGSVVPLWWVPARGEAPVRQQRVVALFSTLMRCFELSCCSLLATNCTKANQRLEAHRSYRRHFGGNTFSAWFFVEVFQ